MRCKLWARSHANTATLTGAVNDSHFYNLNHFCLAVWQYKQKTFMDLSWILQCLSSHNQGGAVWHYPGSNKTPQASDTWRSLYRFYGVLPLVAYRALFTDGFYGVLPWLPTTANLSWLRGSTESMSSLHRQGFVHWEVKWHGQVPFITKLGVLGRVRKGESAPIFTEKYQFIDRVIQTAYSRCDIKLFERHTGANHCNKKGYVLLNSKEKDSSWQDTQIQKRNVQIHTVPIGLGGETIFSQLDF